MNTEVLLQSFELMGKGMLAIFVVIVVIYLVVQLLLKLIKLFGKRKEII